MVLALVVIAGLLAFSARLFGFVRFFSVPSSGMAPTLSPGDHIAMEDLTFLARHPRLGDVIIFRTGDLPGFPRDTIIAKRIAGGPGDRLRISNGRLFVNDRDVSINTGKGPVAYTCFPGSTYLRWNDDAVTVPAGYYFVLGDNSTNSFDSRFFGFLPASNVMGRVALCYWPPGRAGAIR